MPRIFSRFAQVMRLRRRRTVKQTAKLDDVPPSLPIDSVLFAGSVHHQGDDGPVERAVSPPPATSATNCTNANTTAAAQREVTTVESLPAELRSRILSHLTNDLGGLSALVLASPVFYQQYLLERPALLRAGLKTALGNVVADAYAVRASARLYKPLAPDSPAHVDVDAETIKLFIDKHVTVLRLATPDQILQEYCTENDLMRMAAFYYSLARPLSLKLAIRFLSRLNPSLDPQGKLSTTESTRLLRALYRWQLYCNLFGPGPEMMRRRKVAQLEHGTHLDILFCLFKPWEIEEVYCIWVLLRDTYRGVADSVTWDLNRDHPRFRDWPNPLALGSWDLGNEFICELAIEGIAMRGLLAFDDIITEDDHEELVELMQCYLVEGNGMTEDLFGRTNQYFRRERLPLEGDEMEARRERLGFSREAEDGPPLAWVIYWRGKYSNRYGETVDPGLHKWGYVFWDKKRLVKMKGTEEVLRARDRYNDWL